MSFLPPIYHARKNLTAMGRRSKYVKKDPKPRSGCMNWTRKIKISHLHHKIVPDNKQQGRIDCWGRGESMERESCMVQTRRGC